MIGRTLAHYQILEKLGEGGMGAVYKARDTHLDRFVAIKVLPPERVADPDRRRRFVQEAKAASALNDPNIITIYDIDAAQGVDFIAMEIVEGQSMERAIAGRRLPVDEALAFSVQIASALAAAHRAGIVHRDVKPANIMVTQQGLVKVLDFGLAKLTEPAAPNETDSTQTLGPQTQIGVVLGTAAYMSPEQAEGNPVDARSDVFSLGSVLYEMLAGRRPFKGDSQLSTRMAILRDSPPPLKVVRHDVPAVLEHILQKCLEKNPGARYSSAAELWKDLAACQTRLARVSLRSVLRRPRYAVPAVFFLAGILALGTWFAIRESRLRWARNVALPEIVRLNESEKFADALGLVRRAERFLPGDPELARLRRQCSSTTSLTTSPAGADVAYKPYTAADAAWETLGKTPVQNGQVPRLYLRWRIMKEGFDPLEAAGYVSVPPGVRLSPRGAAPPGMVLLPGGVFSFRLAQPARLDDYWLDRYEVTNRQFKEFIDRGGYDKREHWKQPFVEGGRQIPWEEAIARFRDVTGRPGPATWELGAYPEGQADYPVSGVSWYEAAAYAEFAGKSLPTIYHWLKAAGISYYSDILQCSNFSAAGPVRVGSRQGLSPYGNYDMAGNVKEWCWNQAGDLHYILGAAYNEPTYMFSDYDAQSPFARSSTFGFRCAKYSAPPSGAVLAPIKALSRDYAKEKPASDEAFRVYRTLFSYDRTELKSAIEATDDSSPYWRRERVTFDAAYGGERVVAILFLPRNVGPPYQTVVYFPGSSAFMVKSSSNSIDGSALGFVMRSGRALLYPIYKGSYERGSGAGRPDSPNAWRGVLISSSMDLGRSLDYLETRSDIDRTKLAYYGLSAGAVLGPVLTAVDSRFRAAVLEGGGLMLEAPPAETDPINFASRARMPVLMLNGRFDFTMPVATNQLPLFRLLGAPEKDKRHVLFDAGHAVPRAPKIKEILDWLDRYLGPVKLQPIAGKAAP